MAGTDGVIDERTPVSPAVTPASNRNRSIHNQLGHIGGSGNRAKLRRNLSVTSMTAHFSHYPPQQPDQIGGSNQHAMGESFVVNELGGEIVTDDPGLAAWAVDAMRLVREELYRAGAGRVLLPFSENWIELDGGLGGRGQSEEQQQGQGQGQNHEKGASSNPVEYQDHDLSNKFPVWASLSKPTRHTHYQNQNQNYDSNGLMKNANVAAAATNTNESGEGINNGTDIDGNEHGNHADDGSLTFLFDHDMEQRHHGMDESVVVITDLALMAEEVSELLNAMELFMMVQRNRRLEKLRRPVWLRRNWYVGASGLPVVLFVMHKLFREGYGKQLATYVLDQSLKLYQEHVYQPLYAM